MRIPLLFALCMIVVAGHVGAAEEDRAATLEPTELMSWPRMQATAFGCMLETRFAVHDPKYNCAASFDKIDWGDTCRSAEKYYAGPALPERVAKTLPAPIENVSIEWEHGEIQGLSIQFDRKMSRMEIGSLLGIDFDGAKPDNVMSADVSDCAMGKSCANFQGFDHMGAADVDCDEERPAPKK